MKRSFFIFLAFLALSASVSNARPTGLTLGGGAFWDWSKTSLKGFSDPDLGDRWTDNYGGAYIEVGYNHFFGEHSSIYGGLRFSEVVTSNMIRFAMMQSSSAYLTVKNYLSIPVKYAFNFNLSPKVQMYVNAGPTVDFWLNFTSLTIQSSFGLTDAGIISWLTEAPDTFSSVNLGLGGAVGVFFNHVKIELAYDQYVTDFYRPAEIVGSRGQLRLGAAYVF